MTADASVLEVVEACRWFDGDARADQEDYKRASAFDWVRIDEADEGAIFGEGGPIWFLDRWRAFNIRSMWPDQLDPSLPRTVRFAHKNARPSLEALMGLDIVDVDLNDKEVAQRVRTCLYSMASVGMRFKHVAAAKYLHMCNPSLFVMWDTSIATNGYGIPGFSALADSQMEAANEYVGRFLPEAQRRIRVLLDEVVAATGCTPAEAPGRLRSTVPDTYGIKKTCAKIIDEYNYFTYTRRPY
jgi:hypothetical protein